MPTKWLGAKKLTLKPGGVSIEFTDRLSGVLEFHGPYDLCLAHRPARGAVMPGFAGMTVDKALVRRAQAPGFGELVVYLSDDDDDDSETTGDPITEITWLEVERDLYQHPLFAALTRASRRKIELWKTQADPAKYDSYIWPKVWSDGSITDGGTLAGTEVAYAIKFDAGIDSYKEYTPVASLVTFSRSKPNAIRTCGKRISGKPFAACPNGYVWLRVADDHHRSGRRGKWQRTQRFVGALAWDTDLYGAES
jgi:hypothetical protein